MKNILTFDIEDWFQSTFDLNRSISSRVVSNTAKLLDILSKSSKAHGATFFVQGMVAEKFPSLVQAIAKAGYEIASHGYSHRPVNQMSPEEFREDLTKSIRVLEDIVQKPIEGYRAPDFSIDEKSFWAFRILKQLGITYDSSVFPKKMRRYGIADFSRDPVELSTYGIKEIPLSIWSGLPIAGGGYLRLFPYALTRTAIQRMNRLHRSAVVYMHPYEINPKDFAGENIPLKIKLHQGLFRSRMASRLGRLLQDFDFISCREFVGDESKWSQKIL